MPTEIDLLQDILTRMGDLAAGMTLITEVIELYLLPLVGVLIFVVLVCTCIKNL